LFGQTKIGSTAHLSAISEPRYIYKMLFAQPPTTYNQNLSEIDQKSISDELTSSTNNASASSGLLDV